ncbi:MAG: hypothetical protein H9W81_05115 [Enterococcus sp.]|nr:hypothetical protein [Enterococcus sp.]
MTLIDKNPPFSYTRYYNDAVTALQIIGQAIVSDNRNVSILNKGRTASTDFEKTIALPVLFGDKETLMKSINKKFSDDKISTKITSITVDEEEQSEAQSRAWLDFSFTLEINGSACLVPVNIKYTSGKTKDNVGGWEALSFCLYGSEGNGKGVKGVFENQKLKNGDWIDAPIADYFLISFLHGEKKATEEFKVASLLTLTENERAFNDSQSFPVQARISETSRNVQVSMTDARKNFVEWILTKKVQRAEAETKRWTSIRTDFTNSLKS